MCRNSEITSTPRMPIARKTLVIFLVIGFASLWAAAIVTHSKLEGSAFRGHVREGTYCGWQSKKIETARHMAQMKTNRLKGTTDLNMFPPRSISETQQAH